MRRGKPDRSSGLRTSEGFGEQGLRTEVRP